MRYPEINKRTHTEETTNWPAVMIAPALSRVSVLGEADRDEVLRFLKARPVHTVVMTSFINDNGLESELNRGRFYGYRNNEGTLEELP
jgi:hypothetical protein